MTDELKALAGRDATDFLKLLAPIDLIEFAETFGVGIEDIATLPASERMRAFAWLFWKAKKRQGYQGSFEDYLNEPGALAEWVVSAEMHPLARRTEK